MSRGPGKWQRYILELLEEYHGFAPRQELQIENSPSHAQYTAFLRAARLLAKRGKCKVTRIWAADRNRRETAMVFICNVDTNLEDLEIRDASTRYETRGLRRTAADKRRAVEVLLSLEAWREKDSATIAAFTGAPVSVVDSVRGTLSRLSVEHEEKTT
jgi:hypothetical protein